MEKLPQIKETKHRIPSFDILRVVLIFLVINIHRENFTDAITLFPSRFGWYAVPSFIILSFYLTSGFYLSHTPAFASAITRAKRFFIPFLFWSALGFIVSPEAVSINNISIQLFTGSVVNVPLYYLLLMSIFTLVFYVITFIPLRQRITVMIMLTAACFYLQYTGINYLYFSNVEPPFMYSYGRIVELLPFAVTGALIGFFARKTSNAAYMMLVTGLVGGLFFASQATKQPEGVDYSGTILYFGSLFIFLYFLLIKGFRLSEDTERLIRSLGSYSFGVYASHYLIFELLFRYVPATKEFNKTFPLLFLLIFTAASYGIVIGANKITRYRVSYLFK